MSDDRLQHAKAVCARIKQARERAGLNQTTMAEALGVRYRTYQNYESEASPRVPWGRLEQIADLTGVEKAWLVSGVSGEAVPLEESLRRIEAELRALRAALGDPPIPPGHDEGGA